MPFVPAQFYWLQVTQRAPLFRCLHTYKPIVCNWRRICSVAVLFLMQMTGIWIFNQFNPSSCLFVQIGKYSTLRFHLHGHFDSIHSHILSSWTINNKLLFHAFSSRFSMRSHLWALIATPSEGQIIFWLTNTSSGNVLRRAGWQYSMTIWFTIFVKAKVHRFRFLSNAHTTYKLYSLSCTKSSIIS